ncbi:MAG: NAD-dependent succinate-semialdehyde dehydrogenase [Gemmatimonadaceae bacterium]|nr:NAD-dependent succinate-semialdehyde dehydrogenase [Gemmatimonadaceae bacterium]
MTSTNPHGGEIIARYTAHSSIEIDRRLSNAEAAQKLWRRTAVSERAAHVRRIAAALRQHADELATTATLEMGKPITAARAEVEKCARCCEWYADQAHHIAAQSGPTEGDEIRLEPLGVLLAIMPWNFPYWQVVRVVTPALLLGNTVVLKHAENVSGCALALEQAVTAAGGSSGLFEVLLITRDLASALIADARIAAVTITGSERAGIAVATAAGAVLKPVVLELGGSDPFLVWHDVDIPVVAKAAALARCVNGGQSCIAAKRFLVHDAIHDRFLAAFIAAMQTLKVSDPRATDTDIGPLVSVAARDTLHTQVTETLAAGATLQLGGVNPGSVTAWYPPTIVTDIPDGSTMAVEELFGPVAGVWRVSDLDDAIMRANSTRFGLGASVWTNDREVAHRCAAEFDTGSVMINQPVVSDPALPFGGVKASGHGRELGVAGLAAFANIKTVRGLLR